MLFVLSTPEYNTIQANTTKVKVHLRNGVAEIYEQHQDLIGKVENNLIEIETNFENKSEKFLFVLQDAVFIVSTKGLDKEKKGTEIYVYAKKAKEITSKLSVEELTKQFEAKKIELDNAVKKSYEDESLNPIKFGSSPEVLVLEEDLEFFRKILTIAKQVKS